MAKPVAAVPVTVKVDAAGATADDPPPPPPQAVMAAVITAKQTLDADRNNFTRFLPLATHGGLMFFLPVRHPGRHSNERLSTPIPIFYRAFYAILRKIYELVCM